MHAAWVNAWIKHDCRARSHGGAQPVFVCRRIGLLGPELQSDLGFAAIAGAQRAASSSRLVHTLDINHCIASARCPKAGAVNGVR
jgi:hypothetical protein